MIEAASKVAPLDVPILIEGEMGSGKEYLARAIHFASRRAEKEFVSIDFAGTTDPVLECELFGYLRGSFAGALHDKKGLLELAAGGTVFLDHLSKASPSLQVKLCRLLETQSFHKIGGISEIEADIRFLAATDEDLKGLVEKGKFREDLFYQLSTMRILVPPLRERGEDIVVLAKTFLGEMAERKGETQKELSQDAQAALLKYRWPGNVRELRKEMERAVMLVGDAQKVTAKHLSPHVVVEKKMRVGSKEKLVGVASLRERKKSVVAALEEEAIRDALRKMRGNRTHAAQLLCISRQELLRKIHTYKIK